MLSPSNDYVNRVSLHFNLASKFRHLIIGVKGRFNHIWTLNIHIELALSCLEMDFFSYFSERNFSERNFSWWLFDAFDLHFPVFLCWQIDIRNTNHVVSILLYHRTTYSQKEKLPRFTRPDGLIDKNPCRNATQLLQISWVGRSTKPN